MSANNEQVEEEIALFRRAAELRHGAGRQYDECLSTFYLACAYHVVLADSQRALPVFKESHQLAKESGNRMAECLAVRHIGQIHQQYGRMDHAHQALLESLGLREAMGWRPGTGPALLALATLERMRGNLSQALDYGRQAWKVSADLDMTFVMQRIMAEYHEITRAALGLTPQLNELEVFNQINR